MRAIDYVNAEKKHAREKDGVLGVIETPSGDVRVPRMTRDRFATLEMLLFARGTPIVGGDAPDVDDLAETFAAWESFMARARALDEELNQEETLAGVSFVKALKERLDEIGDSLPNVGSALKWAGILAAVVAVAYVVRTVRGK